MYLQASGSFPGVGFDCPLFSQQCVEASGLLSRPRPREIVQIMMEVVASVGTTLEVLFKDPDDRAARARAPFFGSGGYPPRDIGGDASHRNCLHVVLL